MTKSLPTDPMFKVLRNSSTNALWATTLTLIAASATSVNAASSVTVASTGAKRQWVRVDAINPSVVRIWFSQTGAFTRKPSQALETMQRAKTDANVYETPVSVSFRTSKLLVRIDRKTLTIDTLDAKTGLPIALGIGVSTAASDGSWKLTESLAPDEHLLGLGEDNRNQGKLERRGTIRELWAGQQIKSGNVTAQYPVPLMLSTGASSHSYGVFLDNVHRLSYDLGKTAANRVQVDASGGEADVYVIDGPTPKAVISRYTAMTGRPSLPPLWSLGYIQSRCVFYNWSDIDSAYEGLRSRGYPVDCMVIDYNWPEFMNDFVWDKRWTVDGVQPGTRVENYLKKGVKTVMSISGPMLKSDSPTFPPGVAAGVFATDGKGAHVKAGYYGGDLLDFTSPNMSSWLWPQLRPRNMEGIAGWWLDLTEPEGEPPQTIYDGGTADEIHNAYSNLVTRSYEGSQLQDHPNERPFILTRAGSAGIQAHHAALWTGDINSDYVTLAAHPGEMLNSGISGLNAWTCDTGGFLTGYYKNDRFGAHARLYERWMQFSTFSPITRAHKAGLCMPYEFGPATEQGTKNYLNLRYRLLPYIYSHFYEASQTGIPIVRAMPVEFPSDPNCLNLPGDQYMFGASLLVAPVLNEGVSKRPVYFPPGRWIDWDYGYVYPGGKTWVVNAPQNRIPVAVRPGAIIPMAPNMSNTKFGKWDPLNVEVFPSGSSHFTMTQDDGRSFDYQKGKLTQTTFTSTENATRLGFEIDSSNALFVPRKFVVRFHLDRKPLSVSVDGKSAPVLWDERQRILETIVESTGKLSHAVSATLSPQLLPVRPAPKLVADKVDLKQEVSGPIPHFFPGPALPASFPAIDYDNGGEGIGYHVASSSPSTTYRPDNAGIRRASVPSGYILGGLQKGDWVRYSVNSGNGGYFDLTAGLKGRGQIRLLSAARDLCPPITPSSVMEFESVVEPNIYLNPGQDSLMLFVDQPGFELESLEFKRSKSPPTEYPASFAAFTGQVVVTNGVLGNVGQLKGSVTMGIESNQAGPKTVRIRYANGGRKVRLQLAVNGGEEKAVDFPNSGGGDVWKNLDLSLDLQPGANRVTLSWINDGYDSIGLKSFSVLGP